MKRLATLLAVAALLTGCAAATPTAPVPRVLAQATEFPAAGPDLLEDDPRWRCEFNGDRICAATAAEAKEAWDKLDVSTLPAEVRDHSFRIDYRGTALTGIDFPPSEYVTIPATPSTVHVFQISKEN